MEYTNKLSHEVIAVGAMTVLSSRLVEKMFPKASKVVQIFLSGALIHLGCEFSGLNKWYIEHSAAAETVEPKIRENRPSIVGSSRCRFVRWED
jgi:hypothetical protein